MQISLDTSTASTGELTALIALLASLGGRLPAGVPLATVRIDGTEAAAAPRAVITEHEQSDANEDPAALPIAGALDSTGVPWDARIHSTPASLTKDGAYRKRRGLSEVEFGRIHGELAELHASPNPTTGTTTSGAVSQQSGTAATQDAPPPPEDDEAPPPPADDGPNVSPASARTGDGSAGPAAVDAARDANGSRFAGFPEFVGAVNAIRPAPGIPFAELNTFASAVGVVGGFKDMRLHPELWEDFYAMAGGQ